MTFLSGLGILLSLVCGCLLLALVAELYYLLWWKKKRNNNSRRIEKDYRNHTKELFYLFCWSKPHQNNTNESTMVSNPDANGHDPDLEMGSSKDLLLKSLGEDGVESDIIRLQNLTGPSRFLFTIKEETKEDLESDDGKSRGDMSRKGSRTRSLSDLIVAVETPYLSPLASPSLKPSGSLKDPLDSYIKHGFNPLFESSVEAELGRLRSSPPPKFKFLRDAEEKLYRRLMEEAQKSGILHVGYENSEAKACQIQNSSTGSLETDEKTGSLMKAKGIYGKNKEREIQHHSSSSQVLPLASSPPASLSPS